MKATSKQITEINNSLDHGDKKVIAELLGITAPALSRYLKLKRMPTATYHKILNFINSKKAA